jgi:hypothetical protein
MKSEQERREFMQMAKRQHAELRMEWIKEKCPKPFYWWLMDRIERVKLGAKLYDSNQADDKTGGN